MLHIASLFNIRTGLFKAATVVTALAGLSAETCLNPGALFAADSADVTVTISGTGRGSVNSSPAGIACSSGSGSGCFSSFPSSPPDLTLMASPANGSRFDGWSGCTTIESGTGNCVLTLAAPVTVGATFTTMPLVRLAGMTIRYFGTIQDAYDQAGEGHVLSLIARTYGENLDFNRPISILLTGGFSSDFTTTAGTTVLQGTWSISDGSVTVGDLAVE